MKTFLFAVALQTFAGPAQAAPQWREWEQRSLQIEREILRPMSKAWRARDIAASQAAFAENAVFCDFALPEKPDRTFDGIRQYTRPAGPVAAQSEVKTLLGSAAAVDDLGLTLLDLSADGSAAEVWFDLRARMADGALRTDRGQVTAKVQSSGGKLRLASLTCPKIETLVADRPLFEEATSASGLGAIKPVARQEAIRRGGYALAVADYDGSGSPSVFVGGRGPGQLLHNDHGHFVDVTKKAGLGQDTMVKAALFADFDNDGRLDLVLQRFVDDEDQELVFYRNVGGGRFEKVKAQVKRLQKHDRPMGMAAADFNDDGRLDLYVGYPGVRDFTDSAMDEKKVVSHQAVYLNRGNWAFEEAPESSRPESAIYGALVRPHSAIGLDLGHTGHQDLLVIDDRGAPTRFYLNFGGGRFEERQDQAGLKNLGWGMTAAAGDFAGDGRDAVYFSNVDFSVGRRIIRFIERAGGPDATIPGFERVKADLQGNRLYRSRSAGIGDIAFDDVTKRAGVGWAGEAPAGAVWVDYDADGQPDLFVSNGLWSADPDRSADSEFIMGQLAQKKPQGVEEPNRVMKELQKSGASLGGYQHKQLFHNNGDGTFTEVGYVAGVDRTEDGYVVATGDFDGDGRVDLLLRNTDPPSLKYAYSPVTLLLNRGQKDRTLALSLRGRDGAASFGALVTAYYPDGHRQGRQLRTVEGAVQSQPVIYLGMGEAKTVDLDVLWPSGVVDHVKDAKSGRLTIAEGRGVVAEKRGNLPPETGAPKSCRDAFMPERRLDEIESLASKKGSGDSTDALYYGLYTAIGRGDPSACVVARSFHYEVRDNPGDPRSMTGEWLCKSYYHHMNFRRSFVTNGPDFGKACSDFMRFEEPGTKPEEAAEICGVIAANRDDPPAMCAKQVVLGYRNPRELAKCERNFRALNGDAACEAVNWNPTHEDIGEHAQPMQWCPYVAFWRARKGDPALCGKSDVCRALTGESAALAERYRLRLAGAVCTAGLDAVPASAMTAEK